jgi:hypothetical protein
MRGPLPNDGARPDLGWLIARPIAIAGSTTSPPA